jgi:hypothetical protein
MTKLTDEVRSDRLTMEAMQRLIRIGLEGSREQLRQRQRLGFAARFARAKLPFVMCRYAHNGSKRFVDSL